MTNSNVRALHFIQTMHTSYELKINRICLMKSKCQGLISEFVSRTNEGCYNFRFVHDYFMYNKFRKNSVFKQAQNAAVINKILHSEN